MKRGRGTKGRVRRVLEWAMCSFCLLLQPFTCIPIMILLRIGQMRVKVQSYFSMLVWANLSFPVSISVKQAQRLNTVSVKLAPPAPQKNLTCLKKTHEPKTKIPITMPPFTKLERLDKTQQQSDMFQAATKGVHHLWHLHMCGLPKESRVASFSLCCLYCKACSPAKYRRPGWNLRYTWRTGLSLTSACEPGVTG